MGKDNNLGISICMGSSCFSRGNGQNLEIIKKFLEDNHLDINIHLKGQLCTNLCSKGPIININNRQYSQVHPSELVEILKFNFNIE